MTPFQVETAVTHSLQMQNILVDPMVTVTIVEYQSISRMGGGGGAGGGGGGGGGGGLVFFFFLKSAGISGHSARPASRCHRALRRNP